MIPTLPRAAATILLLLGALAPAADARAAASRQPDAPASVASVLRVSIGADGTVATVVALRGPGGHEAVVLQRGDAASLIVRTGVPVETLDGHRFELRAIGRAWTVGGAVAWLGTTVEGPPVLVLHGADGDRVVAIGADPGGALLASAERPVTVGSGCAVELEVFELLGPGAAPVAEDGSVRFPAWLGAPCAGTEATVRYRDGVHAVESITVAPMAASEIAAGALVVPSLAPDGRIDVADGTGPLAPVR